VSKMGNSVSGIDRRWWLSGFRGLSGAHEGTRSIIDKEVWLFIGFAYLT
jgi:hypothetical protein